MRGCPATAQVFVHLAEYWQTLRRAGRRARIVRSHARGLSGLFEPRERGLVDQLLLATASNLVLAGLAAAARANVRMAAIDWHAMLHFTDRPPDEYALQTCRRNRSSMRVPRGRRGAWSQPPARVCDNG